MESACGLGKLWTGNVSIAAVGATHVCVCRAYKLLSARQECANVSGNPQWSTLLGLPILAGRD